MMQHSPHHNQVEGPNPYQPQPPGHQQPSDPTPGLIQTQSPNHTQSLQNNWMGIIINRTIIGIGIESTNT